MTRYWLMNSRNGLEEREDTSLTADSRREGRGAARRRRRGAIDRGEGEELGRSSSRILVCIL